LYRNGLVLICSVRIVAVRRSTTTMYGGSIITMIFFYPRNDIFLSFYYIIFDFLLDILQNGD
jgi:hypothetical protein